VVIVREDLLGHHATDTPFMLNWELQAKSPGTYFNTPATYPIYVTGLNVAFMVKNGGLNHYIELADKRAKMLYDFIDNSNGFYSNSVDKRYRSKINVPIRIRADKGEKAAFSRLELQFLKETTQ